MPAPRLTIRDRERGTEDVFFLNRTNRGPRLRAEDRPRFPGGAGTRTPGSGRRPASVAFPRLIGRSLPTPDRTTARPGGRTRPRRGR